MSQAAEELEFLSQVTVQARGNISVPNEPYQFLKDNINYNDLRYHWTYDTELDYLFIAGHEATDSRYNWLGVTEHQSPNGRTTIPKSVMNRFDIERGDDLYLVTHDLMHLAERPGVVVWKSERIDGILIDQNESESEILTMFPEF